MLFISSNHFSHDIQISDAVRYLDYLKMSDNSQTENLAYDFAREFPEYATLKWYGSWVDTESSNVDVEYMSWVCDWLESHTPIQWRDGEPVIYEEGDETDEL